MNPVLKSVGIFIRDLLGQPESIIKIGRENFVRDDFKALQIVIDAVGASTRTGQSKSYDGDNELQTITQAHLLPCTIDFYGDGAYILAAQFVAILQSQLGIELQQELGITVYNEGSLTDVKMLTGEQYSERLQVALNVRFNISYSVSAKRIDTMQLEITED